MKSLPPADVPDVSRTLTRIAITGLGMVTPMGLDCDSSWQGLLTGRGAARWLEQDFPDLSNSCGASVPWKSENAGRLVPFARRAAAEAILQSGLTSTLLQPACCVIGTSKIDMPFFDSFARSDGTSTGDMSLMDVVSPASAATAVAKDWGCEGGTLCPVAACATGLVSILRGADLIRSGTCSTAIVGSSDAALHRGLLASYRRLGVHARPDDDPATACRPFDRDRTGFVVGEGAACLVLEEWEQAQSRGAPILAEFLSGRIGSDPTGLTRVDSGGEVLVHIVSQLLNEWNLTPNDISCVSLHGTATRLNDEAEAIALMKLFGERSSLLPAFGIKGAIGHLMGAAGSVETAASVLCLQHQTVLPTCNHREPDQKLAVSLSPEPRQTPLTRILKLSLGFGGHIAAALIQTPSFSSTREMGQWQSRGLSLY
ncbi:MAG TPA: beta-ketoacyl-[acyl-carrier-protein] synthase family protein [Planctomicrobium sp.]|nr:beta-ketoacyl-[acyl-carrier-protein] synthase family protein [Planctomicrobium sp.]